MAEKLKLFEWIKDVPLTTSFALILKPVTLQFDWSKATLNQANMKNMCKDKL